MSSLVDTHDPDKGDMVALQAGEDLALNHLMDRHGERLWHFLIRILGNEQDALDAAQETFEKIYLNRMKFRSDQKFTTWMFAIASNHARDRIRWRMRHPVESLDSVFEKGESALPHPNAPPDEEVSGMEEMERIRKAVASLPEDLRIPLVLSVYENYPYAEISSILNCSEKAVEMKIYRARKRLKTLLDCI